MLRLLVLTMTLVSSAPSWARSYDVSLSNLGDTPTDRAKYRSLAQEMGLVLAPLHIGPARTTGHSGFEYTLRVSSHNIHQTRSYWTDVSEGGVMDLEGQRTLQIRCRQRLSRFARVCLSGWSLEPT